MRNNTFMYKNIVKKQISILFNYQFSSKYWQQISFNLFFIKLSFNILFVINI